MATPTYTQALPIEYKTTLNLNPGDIIQEGDCISGFWTFEIVSVTKNAHLPTMPIVTMKFQHGGQGATPYGKNTRWSVVKDSKVTSTNKGA